MIAGTDFPLSYLLRTGGKTTQASLASKFHNKVAPPPHRGTPPHSTVGHSEWPCGSHNVQVVLELTREAISRWRSVPHELSPRTMAATSPPSTANVPPWPPPSSPAAEKGLATAVAAAAPGAVQVVGPHRRAKTRCRLLLPVNVSVSFSTHSACRHSTRQDRDVWQNRDV